MVRAAGNVIVNQASACINQARVYITVYEYAKVSGMDYEAAAAEMLGKETEQNKRMMMENRRAIGSLLNGLGELPPELAGTQARLLELHKKYLQIHSLAINPSGSMEGFNESINDLQNQLLKAKRDLDTELAKPTLQFEN